MVRVRVKGRIRVRDRVIGPGFDYFRHCAICIALNTKTHYLGLYTDHAHITTLSLLPRAVRYQLMKAI